MEIHCVRRRAKFLLIETAGFVFINHLGMSGSWRFSHVMEHKTHDHIVIELQDGRFLIYHDPRRFGIFEAVARGSESESRWLKRLGVEPLGADWTAEYLHERARGRDVTLKSLLLDQRIVAGLGNIYVSEALFDAKVKPTRVAKRLRPVEAAAIVTASRALLLRAIASGGTTLRDYRQPNGKNGDFRFHLNVYGRNGEPCLRCRATKIRKVVQTGRSSYYCSKCQR
jgi:formamidopyrimidine-DNA glycosylase